MRCCSRCRCSASRFATARALSNVGSIASAADIDDEAYPDIPTRRGRYARYDDAVTRARTRIGEAIAAGGLDQPVNLEDPDRGTANLRRLLLDLLEEYGRHTGHADLLRESVDGRTGEDPPDEWRTPWD